MSLPPSHPLITLYTTSGVDQHSPVWFPGARQPLFVRALLAHAILDLPPPPPQPISPHSPLPPWLDISDKINLHLPGLPPTHGSAGVLAPTLFLQLDRTLYHHHLRIYTDGSHSPSPSSTAAAIYLPASSTCTTWRLPPDTDVLTAELYALQQALNHLTTLSSTGSAVIYTDSLSSLHLLQSRHPTSSTFLVHSIQRTLLQLPTMGWGVTLQWVPSHSGIRGNEVADAAAKMGLSEVNITPLPLPLATAKRIISRKCHFTWDTSLNTALLTTSLGQYRCNSSPQPWMRQQSRALDVALTRLRLGHTRLTGLVTCTCPLTHTAHGAGLYPKPSNTSFSTAHAFTLTVLCYVPDSLPWTWQHSTCPPCWRQQAFTRHGNPLSSASPVPSSKRLISCHPCDNITGLLQGS
ncbi:uncharacterized protein LOC123519276 [Portunus trituberculatus]|uniref:uncharacterized protein LOC123519276 n=1 Tax=Portunus trituberculatus TaxID=210409 RepID=UPI001E1D056B|nr:uncharacterized protein LOC123519276 [Portunus trituberculatus]